MGISWSKTIFHDKMHHNLFPHCPIIWALAFVLLLEGCHNKIITDWVAETTEIYFLTSLDGEGPRQVRGWLWFLLKPLSLACRWLPSHLTFSLSLVSLSLLIWTLVILD